MTEHLRLAPSSPPENNGRLEPYVGPRSFQKDQRGFFFGRDEEANELVSLITAHPAVLLYSQSGAGKTSLLNASLIPKLEEEEQFKVLPPMRVQGHIPSTLKIGKNTNIFVLNALMSCSNGDANPAKLSGITFSQFLEGRQQCINQYGEPCPTVIVLDQFEELFTSYPGRWADREGFFEQLGDAMEGNAKKGLSGNPLLRVIFCMREDFIAELDPYLPLMPEKLRTCFRLEHLREKSALLAITKPLAGTNRSYAKGVADQLVKNLLKIPSQGITGTQSLGLYVEPVQLQVVCQSIWEALTPEETLITKKHLEKYGDVSQALSDFYERSIRTVAKETAVKEETLRSWFGETLITSEGSRAPVYRGQDQTAGIPNAAVDKLEAMRLIKGEWKGTNVRWYELAHDRFMEPIRRCNDKWLADQSRSEQIRLRLEAKAAKWQPGISVLEPDELLEAKRLKKAGTASKALSALVDASRSTAQRKKVRQFKLVGVGSAALALVFLTLAVYAWGQRKAARNAEGLAESRLLAIKASLSLENDPELSVLLAKEAIDRFADTEQARDVIRNGLLSLSNVAGVLRGHEKEVRTAAFSPDGRFILTTSEDGTGKLWDVSAKKIVKELRSDQGPLNSSTFSPDGKLIVTTESDGLVRVWDGSTGTLRRDLRGHTDSVNRAVFSPDSTLIATASDDRTARVWNAASGELIKELRGHRDKVHDIVFSPDGIHIATEAFDATGRIWDLRSDKVIVLEGLTGPRSAIAFSPDGKLIATEGGPDTEGGSSIGGDYPVTVWDAATGKEKFTLAGHQQYISGVTFSPNGRLIVTSSGDKTARLWDGNGKLISELRGHTKSVSGAQFSRDSQFVVTGSADNTARVWNGVSGQSVAELRGHSMALNGAAFSPDGQLIVTASDDSTARLWRIRKTLVKVLNGHSRAVTSSVFSPDGTYVVTTSLDGRAWLNDVSGDAPAHVGLMKVANADEVTDATFSPDGKFIATASFDKTSQVGTAHVWSVDQVRGFKDTSNTVLSGHADRVNSVAYSPDGSLIVTASSDRTARVWDAGTGASVAELRGHTKEVNSAAFSPDGKLIITAGNDATVRIWSVGSFAFVETLGAHTSQVLGAEYSPDGNFIVTASADGVGRVWNAKTRRRMLELRGHTDAINSAEFSSDSSLIVTSSSDKTARVWNTKTGESITALRGHAGKLLKASFGPDTRCVLTASEDYTARIYPQEVFAPIAEFLGLIPQRVGRELTPEERREFLEDPKSK
jgi:WD40 repeat protein